MFNAREVFEIAEQIERNGQRFYQQAFDIVEDEDVKQFIKELEEMEVDHEKFFRSLKEKYTEVPDSGFPDIDDSYAVYLEAVADGNKLVNLNLKENQKLTGKESLTDIFEIAIQFEKNTVIFFSFLKSLVPESLGKDKIDAIITEELGHVASLLARMRDMGLA